MKDCKSTIRWSRQEGAVLITAMLLLLVMTIIGISASSTGVMEEKMASNARQGDMALQAAEAALRNGEDLFTVGFGSSNTALTINNIGSIFNGSPSTYPGLYSRFSMTGVIQINKDPVVDSLDVSDPTDWDSTNSIQGQEVFTDLTNQPPAPRFIIEYVGRSQGNSGNNNGSIEVGGGNGGVESGPLAFRITAIGWGQEVDANGNRISRIVSSTVKVPLL